MKKFTASITMEFTASTIMEFTALEFTAPTMTNIVDEHL
jgi:hypothetical protein